MALEVVHQEARQEEAHPEGALPEEAHQEEAHPEEAHQEEAHPEEAHQEEAHPEEALPEEARQEEAPLAEDLLEEDNHLHNKRHNQYPSKLDHAMNQYEEWKSKNSEEIVPMPKSS